jgi:hypothetical protein
MLVRRSGLGSGPAAYSSSRGWYCPGGEPYMWPDPNCVMQCLSTYQELQNLVARTQGLQCPVMPITTTEGQTLYASAGGGMPAPTTQPAAAPTSATAWNPPAEEVFTGPAPTAEAQQPPPSTTTTTTTTEETTETTEETRPAVVRPWTAGQPAGWASIIEAARSVPCWLWVLLTALVMLAQKEANR